MAFGLEDSTIELINSVFRTHEEIESVKVYGSRAKGNFKKASDIDLAYFSKMDITGKLMSELDELPTPYLFDITDYNRLINKELKSHIDRVGQVFFSKK